MTHLEELPGLSRAAREELVAQQPRTVLEALRIPGVGGRTTDRLLARGLLTDAEPTNVSGFLRRMEQWPQSWAGTAQDLPFGQNLLHPLRGFILHLSKRGYAQKTIRRHLDNVWCIGGEIIRRLRDDDRHRIATARRVLLQAVELGEAPLLYHQDEALQRSCDSTARLLLRYLSESAQGEGATQEYMK